MTDRPDPVDDMTRSAWPLTSVLRVLADAADHLLDDHDCDEHGHEETRIAAKRARELMPAPPPAIAIAPSSALEAVRAWQNADVGGVAAAGLIDAVRTATILDPADVVDALRFYQSELPAARWSAWCEAHPDWAAYLESVERGWS